MIRFANPLRLAAIFFLGSSISIGQGNDHTIEIHAHRYAFSPSDITVKQGETVHLKLISDDVPHSLLIKDFGINQAITKTHPVEVSFTPRQAGDFFGRCGHFCGSGHGRMKFEVHVTGN